ncbi:MAG: Uma2 family endonuclease, partial [Ferruginibacter sp.]|nr:Uma2 family endonuclease [Cytophagales bacterium]
DPDRNTLEGWVRAGDALEEITEMRGWVSPSLRIRFELEAEALELFHPDGSRFETYLEMVQRLGQEQQRADQEQQRADQAQQRAELEKRRADALAQRLREMGVDPDHVS